MCVYARASTQWYIMINYVNRYNIFMTIRVGNFFFFSYFNSPISNIFHRNIIIIMFSRRWKFKSLIIIIVFLWCDTRGGRRPPFRCVSANLLRSNVVFFNHYNIVIVYRNIIVTTGLQDITKPVPVRRRRRRRRAYNINCRWRRWRATARRE